MADNNSNLTIEIISYGEPENILGYIAECDNALVYGTPHFLSLISQHLNAKPGWLVARNEGNILGVLPFIVKEGPSGPVYNSLAYYGSNGGVIQRINDEVSKRALTLKYFEMAQQNNALSATIINNPMLQDSAFYNQYSGFDYRDERIGQITHLPESADELMKKFQDPRPRNIRRAEREGITVSCHNDLDALNFLYHTHVDNMNAIGGLAKKKNFFDTLYNTLPKNDWAVYIAKLNEKPIAALLLLYFNRTVEYFTPVVVEDYRNSQPLALVIFYAMQDAVNRGYKNWNWGGTWLTQSGVYDFKKRWGTTEYRYHYYTKIFGNDIPDLTPEFLLKNYEGFFVLPFSALEKKSGLSV